MRIHDSIIKTLAYHDIFDYPLTAEEITKFLTQKASQKEVEIALRKQNKIIQRKNEFYYLKNRQKIILTRATRQRFSAQKFKRAIFYRNLLKFIPSVKVVAVTGALAVANSTKNDDIDLLIVTSKHTLWTTRLLANLVLWPWKRSPNSPAQSGKACLNIFLDESDMKINDQNLYTAHEIAQIKLIYSKNNSYKKFVKINKWVLNYLPNWQLKTTINKKDANKTKKSKTHSIMITAGLVLAIETIAKKIQLRYMKSKQTTEQVGDTQLFFHPKNTEKDVLSKYQKRLRSIKY